MTPLTRRAAGGTRSLAAAATDSLRGNNGDDSIDGGETMTRSLAARTTIRCWADRGVDTLFGGSGDDRLEMQFSSGSGEGGTAMTPSSSGGRSEAYGGDDNDTMSGLTPTRCWRSWDDVMSGFGPCRFSSDVHGDEGTTG